MCCNDCAAIVVRGVDIVVIGVIAGFCLDEIDLFPMIPLQLSEPHKHLIS